MARTHIVAEGETLASIALAEGFHDGGKLFDAPENEELRARRGTPDKVEPGDEVVIPNITPFKTLAKLGHTLVLQRQPQGLAGPDAPPADPAAIHFALFVLRDSDDEPVANEPIVVTDSKGNKHEALSDEKGNVHVEGLPEGEIEVSLIDRDGSDWSIEEPI